MLTLYGTMRAKRVIDHVVEVDGFQEMVVAFTNSGHHPMNNGTGNGHTVRKGEKRRA